MALFWFIIVHGLSFKTKNNSKFSSFSWVFVVFCLLFISKLQFISFLRLPNLFYDRNCTSIAISKFLAWLKAARSQEDLGQIREVYGKLILLFGCVTPQTHSQDDPPSHTRPISTVVFLFFQFVAFFYDLRVFNYNYRAAHRDDKGKWEKGEGIDSRWRVLRIALSALCKSSSTLATFGSVFVC